MRRLRLLTFIALLGVTLSACGTDVETPTPITNTTVNNLNTPTNQITQPQPTNTEINEDVERLRLAKNFVERYGSFSNESDFTNIEDMYVVMTDSMRLTAQQFVASARSSQDPNTPYYGTTTKVRSVPQENIQETAVEYLFTTQRIERTKDSESMYYQDIAVQMVKEGDSWKIHQVRWVPLSLE
ncbi:hypothetical protein ACFL0L_01140 [Patescibacteria group bacterium]